MNADAQTNGLPPQIPGYEYLDALGAGGFADVYLYEQATPRRRVAIKVLRREQLTPDSRRLFQDETDILARLSAHPNVVTLLQAGETDDGRPYLVMEYCSRPGLGDRFRHERFSVPDVLTIGVHLADAVETAHRAGVLHRDIKPANVLVTDFGRPALTDFGIASTLGRGATARAVGLSLPWAAPESIDSGWSGPETDVWGLGATLVSLLTGRSPFERDDDADRVDEDELAERIRGAALAPMHRPDVPAALEQAIRTAMAPSPHGRFTSALAFARALQRVQHDEGLPVTAIEVTGGGTGPKTAASTRLGTASDPRRAPVTDASGTPADGARDVSVAPEEVDARAGAAGHERRTTPTSATVLSPARSNDADAITELFGAAAPDADADAPTAGADSGSFADSGTQLRRPAQAPTFTATPVRRSPVPGILLDVGLVLAVAVAAVLLFVG